MRMYNVDVSIAPPIIPDDEALGVSNDISPLSSKITLARVEPLVLIRVSPVTVDTNTEQTIYFLSFQFSVKCFLYDINQIKVYLSRTQISSC